MIEQQASRIERQLHAKCTRAQKIPYCRFHLSSNFRILRDTVHRGRFCVLASRISTEITARPTRTIPWKSVKLTRFLYTLSHTKYGRLNASEIDSIHNNSLQKIFRAFNFHGLGHPRKYFNNENFPIYGTSLCCTIFSYANVYIKILQFLQIPESLLGHAPKLAKCHKMHANSMIKLTYSAYNVTVLT